MGVAIGAIVSEGVPFDALLQFLPVNGLAVLMYYYFWVVCQQWETMPESSGQPGYHVFQPGQVR